MNFKAEIQIFAKELHWPNSKVTEESLSNCHSLKNSVFIPTSHGIASKKYLLSDEQALDKTLGDYPRAGQKSGPGHTKF